MLWNIHEGSQLGLESHRALLRRNMFKFSQLRNNYWASPISQELFHDLGIGKDQDRSKKSIDRMGKNNSGKDVACAVTWREYFRNQESEHCWSRRGGSSDRLKAGQASRVQITQVFVDHLKILSVHPTSNGRALSESVQECHSGSHFHSAGVFSAFQIMPSISRYWVLRGK